jgi:hypothetical protein
MAGDTEDLVLSISADVRQIQRAIQRLTGETQKATSGIEQQFNKVGTAGGAAFDKVAANSNRAGAVVAANAKRMANAINSSKLQTANLAAQLNDIGVQLAAGTSPFTIAIQQGTQINQVLGQSGVRGAVTLLGGAFTSLINPVSLATIAIIGLGGYAVQYFTQLLSDGEKSAEVLKKEAELIQNVAKQWGDALPALKAYADERARLEGETNIREATQLRIEDIFKSAKEQVKELRLELVDLVTQLQDAGASENEIVRVQRAFKAFTDAVNENRDSTKENKELLEALSTVYINSGVPAANDFASAIYGIADAFAAFAEQAARAAAEAEAAIQAGRIAEFQKTLPGNLGRVGPVYSLGGEIVDEQAVMNDRASRTKSQTQIAAERAGRRGGGGGRKGMSEAEREAEAVAKLIEKLQFEYDMLGKTEQERKVANALRQAGAAATEEQRQKIEELVLAIEREREAIKASEEAMKALQDIGRDFLGGFIRDLREGKSATEALGNALERVGDKLLDMALNNLFSGGFGKGGLFGGLIIPGILHSGGVAGKDGYGHGRAVSPSVFANAPRYHSGGIAGLRPGEVPAILQRGEVVLPKGAKAGGAEVIRVDLRTDQGFIADVADQQIMTRAGTIVQVSVQQAQKAVKANMPGYIADTQSRVF